MNNYDNKPYLDLNELPDPDTTGANSWCENCSEMSTPDSNGRCDCGNKIAHVGMGATD